MLAFELVVKWNHTERGNGALSVLSVLFRFTHAYVKHVAREQSITHIVPGVHDGLHFTYTFSRMHTPSLVL